VRSINDDRYVPGFGLAYLSVVGVFWMMPVCMLGAFGNLGFLVMWVIGLVRSGARRGGRGSFIWACIVWLAMLTAWVWTAGVGGLGASILEPMWGSSMLDRMFSLGGIAWVLSGGLLAWGCWRLRGLEFAVQAIGFDVIPVARRADEGHAKG